MTSLKGARRILICGVCASSSSLLSTSKTIETVPPLHNVQRNAMLSHSSLQMAQNSYQRITGVRAGDNDFFTILAISSLACGHFTFSVTHSYSARRMSAGHGKCEEWCAKLFQVQSCGNNNPTPSITVTPCQRPNREDA